MKDFLYYDKVRCYAVFNKLKKKFVSLHRVHDEGFKLKQSLEEHGLVDGSALVVFRLHQKDYLDIVNYMNLSLTELEAIPYSHISEIALYQHIIDGEW